jgi:predicted dehydrogenase
MNKKMTIKKLKAVIVGYGNRGQVYADYSLDCPEQLEIVGIVDPNPFKLKEAKERYGLSDNALFNSLDAFLSEKIGCDLVINATMDQLHYETAMKILDAGYDMLIEKPIVNNTSELLDIQRKAEEKGCKVFVCHVLRYTPFYRTIKTLLNQGAIGEIMTMEMNEHVCASHYLTAFDRGKWNSEATCGSGFLLAKCCHDLDLMCWLNNSSEPEKVASFGSRSQFIQAKRPKNAAEFCYDCPNVETCPYSAKRQYIYLGVMPFLVWDKLNKPLDEITLEEKEEFLKKDNFGRCAYIAGGDLVDRQNVIVNFENGSCATFNLIGGTTKADRYLHIVGTMGEIEGKLEENKFVLRRYAEDRFDGRVEVIDVTDQVINNAKFGGHSGGDFAIMRDLVAYYNGDTESVSITKLSDSVNGHLCIYAAEKSRKENKIVQLSDMK